MSLNYSKTFSCLKKAKVMKTAWRPTISRRRVNTSYGWSSWTIRL